MGGIIADKAEFSWFNNLYQEHRVLCTVEHFLELTRYPRKLPLRLLQLGDIGMCSQHAKRLSIIIPYSHTPASYPDS